MDTRAPGNSNAAVQAADLEDEFGSFLTSQLKDPAFAAGYEDVQERQAILDKLVKCRIASGLTQTEVAKRMNVSQPTVSGFETESSDPRLSTLQRYARAVQATIKFKMDLPAVCNWIRPSEATYVVNAPVSGNSYQRVAAHAVQKAVREPVTTTFTTATVRPAYVFAAA